MPEPVSNSSALVPSDVPMSDGAAVNAAATGAAATGAVGSAKRRSRPPIRRVLRLWPIGLFIAIVVAWGATRGGDPALSAGTEAPNLTVPWTEGGQFELGAHRGKVVVLAFWATWCPACRAEGPSLARVHDRIRSEGDAVVGVSIDTPPLTSIAASARELGMRYPIARAGRDEVIASFGLELLPTIVVVGPDGRIVEAFEGSASEEAILDAVARGRRAPEYRAATHAALGAD